MTEPSTTPTTASSLRSLCLDHIGQLAAALRKADPSLTREQAVSRAATSREGREAYNLYRAVGAEKPWPEAVQQIAAAELAKASRKPASPKRKTPQSSGWVYERRGL